MARIPLIADLDIDLLKRLSTEAEVAGRAAPLRASNLDEAMQMVGVKKEQIAALVVNTDLGKESVKNLIFASLRVLPKLPVMLINGDKTVSFSESELSEMHVVYVFELPLTYKKILGEIANSLLAKKTAGGSLDQSFSEIQPETMSSSKSTGDDVYVRVRQDRYVKILRKGYSIGSQRLERYMKRGLKNFYQPKKA